MINIQVYSSHLRYGSVNRLRVWTTIHIAAESAPDLFADAPCWLPIPEPLMRSSTILGWLTHPASTRAT